MSCTYHFHRFWRNLADSNSTNPDLNLNLLFGNLYTITLINPAFQIMSCTHHFYKFWRNPADSVSMNPDSDLNLLFGNLYTITLINPAIQIMICIFLANCLGHSNCHVHVSSSNRWHHSKPHWKIISFLPWFLIFIFYVIWVWKGKIR